MKKFIVPEINVVNLDQQDAIMTSPGITDKRALTTVITDETSAQYNMWKGYDAE